MKLYKEDNEALPAYQILTDTDPVPSGFTETTDIIEWSNQSRRLMKTIKGFRDKKCLRDKIKVLVYTKMQVAAPADVENQAKWDLLTIDEKSIAAHYFLVGKPEFLNEVINDDDYWTLEARDYRVWTQEVKRFRVEIMESIVFRRMAVLEEAKDVLQTLDQVLKDTSVNIAEGIFTDSFLVKSLKRQYVEGIDGSVEDDGNGISFIGIADYIDSRNGTPFKNDGFRELTYSFRPGYTADSVADELLTVMDGTY